MTSKSTISGTKTLPETEIEQIELSMEAAKEKVSLRDDLMSLGSNPKFERIFLKGYLKDEAARLASASAAPNMVEQRGEIFDGIKSISHYHQYIDRILREGDQAEEAIREHEAALDEIRAEAEEDGGFTQ